MVPGGHFPYLVFEYCYFLRVYAYIFRMDYKAQECYSTPGTVSPQFSPPVCYQSFIGCGLITTTDSSATLHHLFLPLFLNLFGLTLLREMIQGCTSLNSNPSVLTYKAIQLLGFPFNRKVTRLVSQPRFAFAMFRIPPAASFRPHRYQ